MWWYSTASSVCMMFCTGQTLLVAIPCLNVSITATIKIGSNQYIIKSAMFV